MQLPVQAFTVIYNFFVLKNVSWSDLWTAISQIVTFGLYVVENGVKNLDFSTLLQDLLTELQNLKITIPTWVLNLVVSVLQALAQNLTQK